MCNKQLEENKMTNINPIKFGINGNQYFKHEEKEDLTKKSAKEKQASETTHKQYQSEEVLGFMAAQNSDIIPVKAQKTLDVSKYVTKEQEARIASFMQNFEADYEEAFNTTAKEFPEIGSKTAGEIALAYINSKYKV